ncbi:MAG: CAP domain-containing protein [Candidatus Korobacteraceae bacterium]
MAAVSLPQALSAQLFSQPPVPSERHIVRWSKPAQSEASSGFATDAEQEILSLVNRERRSRGLAPLVNDERLQQAARLHSQRMAAAHEISHQFAGEPELQLRLRAVRWDASGENVAVAGDAERAHTALMHSPHHRDNILDREFNSVGIGVARTAQGVFVTQDFARVLPEASVEQVEEQVARNLHHLRRVPAPELRRRACEMAASDRLNPHAGMSLHSSTRVGRAIAFTAIDPAEIPNSLHNLQSEPASGFSVGACYQSSESYENPVFWILVVTYL